MDTAQWPQGIGVAKAAENTSTEPKGTVEKKPRPQKEQALNCPRCNSTNTKFCYYNNYSLSQPRYFCKTCRRYWTEGGSLRNVPVGGGSRKNKRSSSSSSSSIPHSSKKIIPDLTPPNYPPKISNNHDLNLAYNPYNNGVSEFLPLPFDAKNLNPQNPNTISQNSSHIPVMELLKNSGSVISSRGLGSFMSMNNNQVSYNSNPHHEAVYSASSGLPNLHEFKPGMSFSLDGIENGFGNNIHQDNSRILFPFEDLKPPSNTNDELQQDQSNRGTNGFWNGMLAGGSW